MNNIEQILDYMGKHPVAWRGRPLAEAMYGKDVPDAQVVRLMAHLKYLFDQGRLVRCEVEIPGARKQFEYRISAAGARVKGDLHNFQISRRPVKAKTELPASAGPSPAHSVARATNKPMRRSRKMRRKTGERKTAPKSAGIRARRGAQRVPMPPKVGRWALTSDGAFLHLAKHIEIPREDARELVDFIRRLDGGEA